MKWTLFDQLESLVEIANYEWDRRGENEIVLYRPSNPQKFMLNECLSKRDANRLIRCYECSDYRTGRRSFQGLVNLCSEMWCEHDMVFRGEDRGDRIPWVRNFYKTHIYGATRGWNKRQRAVMLHIDWIMGLGSPHDVAEFCGCSNVDDLLPLVDGWNDKDHEMRDEYGWSNHHIRSPKYSKEEIQTYFRERVNRLNTKMVKAAGR